MPLHLSNPLDRLVKIGYNAAHIDCNDDEQEE
jgi:hypothetical protein